MWRILLVVAALFLGLTAEAPAQVSHCESNFPCWTSATRPASPTAPTIGYNVTNNVLELWDGTSWSNLSDAPIDIMAYGARCDGITDDAASINSALAAAKTINQTLGTLFLTGGVTVQFPADKRCLIRSTLNMTGKRSAPTNGFSFYGLVVKDANLFCATTGAPCIDALGAVGIKFQNLFMTATATAEPTFGIQVGRIDSNGADSHVLDHVVIRGDFSQAVYYNFSSEETTMPGSFDMFNHDTNGYTIVLDGWNTFLPSRGVPAGITSAFQTQTLATNSFQSFQGDYFGPGRIEAAGAQSIWIAGAGQLTFKGTYANVAPGGCNVKLYFRQGIHYGNLNGAVFDMHFENQELDTFCLDGTTASPQITNFRFSTENALQATNSVFKIVGGSSITGVTLYDLDMSVSVENGAVRIFDDPTKWTVTGRVAIQSHGSQQPVTAWNMPNVWAGTLCINGVDASYTGGYCNYTSASDANGPNAGFRSRATASSGSNDFALFSKAGSQGFPVPTFQGWGTAGATAGKLGILTITNGGSGYVAGTYTNVPLTNISSSGASGNATVVVGGGGNVTSVSFTTDNASNSLGTGYKIGDTLSANNASLGGSGSGLVLTVANYSAKTALDVFPLGFQLGDDNNGTAWIDVCNRDPIVALVAAFGCFHPTIYSNGDVGMASSMFTQPRRRMMFGDVGAGYQNWIYANDDFHTLQGNVRGAGTAILSGISQEDASKNLLLQSNNWGATWTLTNATQGASGVEDPWGGTSATLLTSTANSGNTTQAVTVPNDSATYTYSFYVNTTSNPGGGTFLEYDIIFTGGSSITYRVLLIPGSGSLGALATTPTGCLNNDGGTVFTGVGNLPAAACFGYEKVVVGCPAAAGCAGTGSTWYRVWMTGSNNSSGNTTATVRIIPSLNSTGTAIVAGAQLEVNNRVTPYIPTTVAAVQRQPGPIATKMYFASSNSTNLAATATQYYAVGCEAATQICQGVFPSSGTIRNLYMTVQTAPGAGQNNAWTIMAGTGATPGATAITCTISGGAATTCNDITHTARVVAGDTFNIRGVASATATGTGFVTFGFELWTP